MRFWRGEERRSRSRGGGFPANFGERRAEDDKALCEGEACVCVCVFEEFLKSVLVRECVAVT